MGYREFIDSLGIPWKVWSTVPIAGAVLTSEMKDGWLTFESLSSSLRRLAPVPSDWEQLPVEELEQLCHRAAEVRQSAFGKAADVSTLEPNEGAHPSFPESNLNH